MKISPLIALFLISLSSYAEGVSTAYNSGPSDLRKADQIAREVAAWFSYTTGPMDSEHLGQCGDYAVMFVLKYNGYAGSNEARLVIANNPIPSGTYRLEEKVDITALNIPGFNWNSSGIVAWKGKTYIFHPVLGTYRISLERAWTPKVHFGVNMLDPKQVHVWASIGNTSVDPTYFDSWPDQFLSPLGLDE